MSETIQTYITKMIDGSESREDITHFQNQFKAFVKLPKNDAIYRSEGGWRQLLKPVIKPNSHVESLLKVTTISEEGFWKAVTQLKEATHTTVVSENGKNLLLESQVFKSPLEHYNTTNEKLGIILENRVKLQYLDELNLNMDYPDQYIKELKRKVVDEVREAFLVEMMHTIGGPELLGTLWNMKQTNGKTLEKSSSFDIAMFLQGNSNGMIATPIRKDMQHKVVKYSSATETERSDKKSDEVKKVRDKDPWTNKSNNKGLNNPMFTNPNKRAVDAKEKRVDEKKNVNGCEICLKEGKTKAAATHSTKNHDYSYAARKNEDFQQKKKQKVEVVTKK